jgi:hypothetical protein
MPALPPKADMGQHGRDVRFVPIADMRAYRYLSSDANLAGLRFAANVALQVSTAAIPRIRRAFEGVAT